MTKRTDTMKFGRTGRVAFGTARTPFAPPEKLFEVEGQTYLLGQMLAANADDEGFCEWLRTAKPGDVFPGVIECKCVTR